MSIKLFQGDAIEYMKTLESVDAIITDLPYGTTACAWDEIIPFEPMWEQVKRVCKGAFITTTSQPFASRLICSNLGWFKYETIWKKSRSTGHLNAQIAPLRWHENILIFGNGRIIYNPQLSKKTKDKIRPISKKPQSDCYGKYNDTADRLIPLNMSFPGSIIEHIESNNRGTWGLHPTQKPVALYEYLIRTYTNPGDTVLDFCFGSGTTGVACVRTGRNFLGSESDPDYFKIGEKRIHEATLQPALFQVEQKQEAEQLPFRMDSA